MGLTVYAELSSSTMLGGQRPIFMYDGRWILRSAAAGMMDCITFTTQMRRPVVYK